MEFWKEVRRQVLTNELSQRAACKQYGLRIGGQMLIDDLRYAHPFQQRPDHGERAEVATLRRRLVSVPSECHAHKMRKRRGWRKTSFAESTSSGKWD